jgi:hypothetical protein
VFSNLFTRAEEGKMAGRTPLIGDQFRGLPMEDLVGGPLSAARAAQDAAARTSADFAAKTSSKPPPSDSPDQDPDA